MPFEPSAKKLRVNETLQELEWDELALSRQERADLKRRKLTMFLDLDETMLFTTPSRLKIKKGVHVFTCESLVYTARMRPGARWFLKKMKPLYNIYIATTGQPVYATAMQHILEGGDSFFAGCFARENEFNRDKWLYERIRRVFPSGDSMIVKVDDNVRTWNVPPNIICMRPYTPFEDYAVLTSMENEDRDDDLEKQERRFQDLFATIANTRQGLFGRAFEAYGLPSGVKASHIIPHTTKQPAVPTLMIPETPQESMQRLLGSIEDLESGESREERTTPTFPERTIFRVLTIPEPPTESMQRPLVATAESESGELREERTTPTFPERTILRVMPIPEAYAESMQRLLVATEESESGESREERSTPAFLEGTILRVLPIPETPPESIQRLVEATDESESRESREERRTLAFPEGTTFRVLKIPETSTVSIENLFSAFQQAELAHAKDEEKTPEFPTQTMMEVGEDEWEFSLIESPTPSQGPSLYCDENWDSCTDSTDSTDSSEGKVSTSSSSDSVWGMDDDIFLATTALCLMYLHHMFYKVYDDKRCRLPDMNLLMHFFKSQVLKEAVLHVRADKNCRRFLMQKARILGAELTDTIVAGKTTHLVVDFNYPLKYLARVAKRCHVKIVRDKWLNNIFECMESLPEEDYNALSDSEDEDDDEDKSF